MPLKKTIKELKQLLKSCIKDLEKTERGFIVAAQRVRTNTIKLTKVSYKFRRESLKDKEYFDEKKIAYRKYKSDLKAKYRQFAKENSTD